MNPARPDAPGIAAGYERLVVNITRWAESQANVRAALVIGSRARADRPADAWADLDVVLVAANPDPYKDDAAWLGNIGEHSLTFIETSPAGIAERRALFTGGLDVDFALVPAGTLMRSLDSGDTGAIALAVNRGMRVLVDKDGLTARLSALPSPAEAYRPPSPAEFAAVVDDFWYHAVWTAKHLRRGELWWAKSGCDDHLKGLLRQALEWQARAVHGAGHDTWFRGRFLEDWADPQAVRDLGRAFAHYDEADAWRALGVTMDLFRRVAKEAAGLLGFRYNQAGDEAATVLVRQLTPPGKTDRTD